MSAVDDRNFHLVFKGRLALALVSARAERCPDKRCARLRRCGARFGQVGSNVHTPIGACPNMSAAEWRAVSVGIQMNDMRLAPWFAARRASADAADEIVSWEEQKRRWNTPEAAAARAESEKRRLASPGVEYWVLLWRDFHEDTLAYPRDRRAADRLVIKYMRRCGCRCAAAMGMDGCWELAAHCGDLLEEIGSRVEPVGATATGATS